MIAGGESRGPGRSLSVVVPTLNEAGGIEPLLRGIERVVARIGIGYEVLVMDSSSTDGTQEAAAAMGARVIDVGRGYGIALKRGLATAAGEYVLTMDADLSHDPDVIEALWSHRRSHAIGIASRYIPGGSAKMSLLRLALSRFLNVVFTRGLSLRVKDISSGFRLYPKNAIRELAPSANDFDILPELLVRAHVQGWDVYEVPFRYVPRVAGRSKARLIRLGVAYVGTFARLWRLRNSIESADYDERAFDSPVPFQRAWQRRRHAIITPQASPGTRTLDVGCGSSRILRDIAPVVGLDVQFRKLRYMRRYGIPLVNGDIFRLPFPDRTFDTVICSEVIEHIPGDDRPFAEMARVTKPDGLLILGTPDYGRRSWRVIEAMYARLAPGGYADEHITHYDHATLPEYVAGFGYEHLRTEYVFGSEMILTFKRKLTALASAASS